MKHSVCVALECGLVVESSSFVGRGDFCLLISRGRELIFHVLGARASSDYFFMWIFLFVFVVRDERCNLSGGRLVGLGGHL